jgi:GNAT superfamily N-acetyltransferase
MRGIIERLFGWDHVREEKNFAQVFKLDEVRMISADAHDVGWIQEQADSTTINLGSFYIMPAMQRHGIGTQVLEILRAQARTESKAITLSVVRINPAHHFYEKHRFRISHAVLHESRSTIVLHARVPRRLLPGAPGRSRHRRVRTDSLLRVRQSLMLVVDHHWGTDSGAIRNDKSACTSNSALTMPSRILVRDDG